MSSPTASRPRRRRRLRMNEEFASLMGQFPLRPIRTERDYDLALPVLLKLAVYIEGTLPPEVDDYFEVLTLLVEDYDRRHHEIDLSGITPLRMLKHLMENHGMNPADLANVLGGNRALASLILDGKRELSKSHIMSLADHFQISPAVFFPQPRRKTA